MRVVDDDYPLPREGGYPPWPAAAGLSAAGVGPTADAGAADDGAPHDGAADDDTVLISASVVDPEIFGVLVRRRAPAIQRYVIRRIGREAAEDVVAETFVTAFRQRARYRGDGRDCLPWLYGIATRLVHRHRRTEVRRLSLLARSGRDLAVEPFTDRVDAAVTADAAKMRLAAALARLPASQRDALLLLAWADLGYEQIAQATGVPLGTVQSRISRARRRLRDQLADLDPQTSMGDA